MAGAIAHIFWQSAKSIPLLCSSQCPKVLLHIQLLSGGAGVGTAGGSGAGVGAEVGPTLQRQAFAPQSQQAVRPGHLFWGSLGLQHTAPAGHCADAHPGGAGGGTGVGGAVLEWILGTRQPTSCTSCVTTGSRSSRHLTNPPTGTSAHAEMNSVSFSASFSKHSRQWMPSAHFTIGGTGVLGGWQTFSHADSFTPVAATTQRLSWHRYRLSSRDVGAM